MTDTENPLYEKASDLQKVAECYQPLFDLMENEHGKTLLVSELDEIISAANMVQENVKGLFAQTTPPKDEWKNVNDDRPPHLKTVWLCNREKGWVWLGCCVVGEDGYHWAASNGIIYSEKGEIVAECESDDLDVTHFCYLPTLPKLVN